MAVRTRLEVCDECRGLLACRLSFADIVQIAEEDECTPESVLEMTRCGVSAEP